jgi:hypothetical protein
MLRAILRQQRAMFFVALGFSMLLAGTGCAMVAFDLGFDLRTTAPYEIVKAGRFAGTMHLMGAIALGLYASIGTTEGDNSTKHIYALSLPVPRWHYLLLRFTAGLITVVVGTACWFAVDALLVLAISLPDGMQTYPFAINLRVLFAGALTFAVLYWLTIAGTRGIGALVIALLLLFAVSATSAGVAHSTTSRVMWDILLAPASPLRIFLGPWSLIDV